MPGDLTRVADCRFSRSDIDNFLNASSLADPGTLPMALWSHRNGTLVPLWLAPNRAIHYNPFNKAKSREVMRVTSGTNLE